MALLNPGDRFPTIVVPRSGGRTLTLPDALSGAFGVVLFYRGSWCWFCHAQLGAFQRAAERLGQAGVRVAALSADDETTTAKLVAELGLTFPVGHSADTSAIAAATGAFVNVESGYLQSTGFLLDPNGLVAVSVYSSGAIGHLLPDDVLGMVRHLA